MSVAPMTQTQVKAVLAGIPSDRRRGVVCQLIGHSRIVTACFGYIYCGRCGMQVADKLGGAGYSYAAECVQVGHNCKTCRENFKKMDWRDKWMTPDPFATRKASR